MNDGTLVGMVTDFVSVAGMLMEGSLENVVVTVTAEAGMRKVAVLLQMLQSTATALLLASVTLMPLST